MAKDGGLLIPLLIGGAILIGGYLYFSNQLNNLGGGRASAFDPIFASYYRLYGIGIRGTGQGTSFYDLNTNTPLSQQQVEIRLHGRAG